MFLVSDPTVDMYGSCDYLLFYCILVKRCPTHKPVDPSRCARGPPSLVLSLGYFVRFTVILCKFYRIGAQGAGPGDRLPTHNRLCYCTELSLHDSGIVRGTCRYGLPGMKGGQGHGLPCRCSLVLAMLGSVLLY